MESKFKSEIKEVESDGIKIEIEEGEDNNESKFTIGHSLDKKPTKAIIFCHGFRPENTKRITGFDVLNNLNISLIKEGWLVSATSYRRDGHIPREEAIEDVITLANYIKSKHEKFEYFILEGQSMGGGICTLISEKFFGEKLFDGCINIGAALYKEDIFTYNPQIPIIFMINEGETYGSKIRDYIKKSQEIKAHFTPAEWTLEKVGHNKSNDFERFKAINFILSWIKFNSNVTKKKFNNTIHIPQSPSQLEFPSEKNPNKKFLTTAVATVTGENIHGHVLTNAQESDLETLGIKIQKKFLIEVDEKEYTVTYSYYPFYGIEENSICAAIDPNGFLQLFILTFKYSSISENLKLTKGKKIFIKYSK